MLQGRLDSNQNFVDLVPGFVLVNGFVSISVDKGECEQKTLRIGPTKIRTLEKNKINLTIFRYTKIKIDQNNAKTLVNSCKWVLERILRVILNFLG